MDSVGLTCPTGRIKTERTKAGPNSRGTGKKGGVFDERGNAYEIPGWVVADPADVIEDGEETIADGEEVEKDIGLDGAASEDEDDDATDKIRSEKGKGRADVVGEMVQVRARLSDRGSDVLVSIGDKQKVKTVARKIQEQAGTGPDKGLRLIYLGKPLNEERTLVEQGWQHGHVLNAYVF